MRPLASVGMAMAVLMVYCCCGCGTKVEEASSTSSGDSLLASNPIERPPSDSSGFVAPPVNPTAEADAQVARMKSANVAFNAPSDGRLGETIPIDLLLSFSEPQESLAKGIRGPGTAETSAIQAAPLMEARLSGQDFAITQITPDRQALTSDSRTEWRWDVRPQRRGTLSLHLTLTALIRVDQSEVSRAIRTFDREIRVHVTPAAELGAFLRLNWQWLWAVLVVPLSGLVWRSFRKTRPAA